MNILEKAKSTGLIVDGGMGSMLIREGLPTGKPSEYWNLERPDIIERIQRQYVEAGSQVLTTNSFGASPLKLQKGELEKDCAQINRRAVEIALQAAGKSVFVAGDIGPSGEMLQPFGLISEEEMIENFAEQAKHLDSAGVHLFIVETMFDLNEALTALKGIRQVSAKPIFATLTFEKNPAGFTTIMGNQVDASMQALVHHGAAAVGANCSIGSADMLELARRIRASVRELVIIQPNAGIPQFRDKVVIYPEDVEHYSDNIRKIKQLGVEIVGGCCGTTPDYIRSIVHKINRNAAP